MAYQVTARKWRPQKFSEMVGQEHLTRTLRNAVITGRIANAYLFVGPRGIGKTTAARILAKALNCQHPVDGEPCCSCSSCRAIADEASVDVIEIDAATHTQVEKARDICEDVLHLPVASKYKIHIIDEVHMLSKSAWNALLKTIEEPPPHAKFIFATTEVNKVLPTVISRCQRFDLARIPSDLIAKRLALIASEEKINISPSALQVIARAADGGMRDAQSLLDQLVSFFGDRTGKETISEDQALLLFGLTAPAEMEALLRFVLSGDQAAVILSIHRFAARGKNLETLFAEILAWLRAILLTMILPEPQTVLDENPEKIGVYRKLAAAARPDTIQILLEQLAAASGFLREAINKQVFMETILLKAMRAAHAVKIEDLLSRLNQIRKNGELDGMDKIPSLAQTPAPPKIPASAKMTEHGRITQPVVRKEVNGRASQNVTDGIPAQNTGFTASLPPPESAGKTPSIPETPEETSDAEAPDATDELALPPDTDEPDHSMPLTERFSPELLWQKLTAAIGRRQPSLAGIMPDGVPDRIDNSTLVVLFDADDGAVSRTAVVKAKPMLLAELRELTGDQTADIQFLPRQKLHADPAPKRKLEELKQEAAANAMVRKVATLFNGEIVDVFE